MTCQITLGTTRKRRVCVFSSCEPMRFISTVMTLWWGVVILLLMTQVASFVPALTSPPSSSLLLLLQMMRPLPHSSHRSLIPRRYRCGDQEDQASTWSSSINVTTTASTTGIRTSSQGHDTPTRSFSIPFLSSKVASSFHQSSSRQEEAQDRRPLQQLETPVQIPAANTQFPPSSRMRPPRDHHVVRNAHELRQRVLNEKIPLANLRIDMKSSSSAENNGDDDDDASRGLTHEVIQLITRRFREQSRPGHRPFNDTARLALCMEGGGMRGAVTAGMAAALSTLGLTDVFDVVYGSSAGSVVGAYWISRQMCLDVYVDLLPQAQRRFISLPRLFSALAAQVWENRLRPKSCSTPRCNLPFWWPNIYNATPPWSSTRSEPGMNISFVLDGIMDAQTGMRPLDMERFHYYQQHQPLRVAASYVDQQGHLRTKCFGPEHYFNTSTSRAVSRQDGGRQGLTVCLEASMTVPGAAGPPVRIQETYPLTNQTETLSFFDAFCCEPLPYRSAVEDGATHVLVLCSRPDGFIPQTRPSLYDTALAPIYFHSNGEPAAAEFFERGGQKYIYAEDLLTLEEGRAAGHTPQSTGVQVPPPQVMYGVDHAQLTAHGPHRETSWKKAHLLPIKARLGTPELSTLEQDRGKVLAAVRYGFAAVFDLLAPATGLSLDQAQTGQYLATMVFPHDCHHELECVLEDQIHTVSRSIASIDKRPARRKEKAFLRLLRTALRRQRGSRNQPAAYDQPHSPSEATTAPSHGPSFVAAWTQRWAHFWSWSSSSWLLSPHQDNSDNAP